MEFTSNVDEKMPLCSIHIHYFPEVLPRLFCRGIFSIAVALVFTAVLHIFTRGGREVGARGKDEVLPQPDGSIVSGGTVQLSFDMTIEYNIIVRMIHWKVSLN
jgi:hypothetical protein